MLEIYSAIGRESQRSYRPWTKAEQQKLLALIGSHSLEQVTLLMRRSPTSLRSMLHRLGASARMGQDWFTKHALAEALHVRSDEVEKWIDRGWLKCRTMGSNGVARQMIDADDFCEFWRYKPYRINGRAVLVETQIIVNFALSGRGENNGDENRQPRTEEHADAAGTRDSSGAARTGQSAVDYGAKVGEAPSLSLPDLDNPARSGLHAPHSYALVIGVEQYNLMPAVQYAAHDAYAIKQYLLKSFGVPEENLRSLAEPNHGPIEGGGTVALQPR